MTALLVPDFIIGGAPRSGTTALAHTLDRHPRIAMAKPFAPEPKVFLAPDPDIEDYRAYFRPGDAERIRGEKSTNYLESRTALDAIRGALPSVRMVFVVREPVSRAYSNWLWSRRNGLEDLPFDEAVEREGARADPLASTRPHARPHAYLSRSRYADLARPWIEALGLERVRFFLYEDLVGDAHDATLRQLQRYVGVEPVDLGTLPTGLENEAAQTGPPLDPGVGARLRELLRDQVQEFAALTGVRVTPWGYG